MASGYGKGSASKDKRVFKALFNELLSGSPRQDIDYNNRTLRQRSRLLFMTEPLAGALINQPRNNVIGLGIFCKPRVDYKFLGISSDAAERLQENYSREYKLWSEDKYSCDAIGMNNIYGLQQLAFTSWLMSGDVFTIFKNYERTKSRPYGLRLQLVEADRCSTPGSAGVEFYGVTGTAANGNRIYDGVEVDTSGLVRAYHICNGYPSDNDYPAKINDVMRWERIPVLGEKTGLPNILHVMNAERPDQYRGVPFLAKVIEPLLQIRRYRESELMAAVIQSFFTVFIKRNSDDSGMPNINEALGGADEKSLRDDEYELGPGTINYLDDDEEAQFAQPTHPYSGFQSFCDTLITHISAALGEPKEIVMLCFNSSYSASRAALMEAWKTYRMFRKWFVDDFCQPAYERWFYEAVLLGRIQAPGYFSDPLIAKAYMATEWIGQAPGMIDPTKDIKSADEACRFGFSTRQAESMKINGSDFYANIAQAGIENAMLRSAGLTGEQPEKTDEEINTNSAGEEDNAGTGGENEKDE